MSLNIKNYKISTKLYMAFAFVLFVIITTVMVSFRNTETIINSTNWIVHTHEVLTELSDIEAKLIDLETGQRGFIITGKLNYLEPYNNSLRILENKLSDLRKLISDNVSQVRRIDLLNELVDSKREELNTTIKLRQQKGFIAAKKIVDTDDGKIIMDKIRVQLSEIENEELRLLEIRSQEPAEARERTNFILISLSFYSLIAIALIAYNTANSITRPINILIDSTKIIGKGNLDYKIGIDTTDETGQLSRSFETMLLQLKNVLASRSALEKEIVARKIIEKKLKESNSIKVLLLDIIAHDLKNPAGVIKGFADFGIESDPDNEILREIKSGTDNLLKVIDDTTILSKVATGDKIDKEEVEITEMIKNISKEFAPELQYKKMKIELNIKKKIIANVNPIISEVFRNYISNAIKYAKTGKKIIIEAKEKPEYVIIDVKDFGKTIAKKDRENVFVRNVQLGNTKGSGLGLAIVKRIAEAHKAKVSVKPNKPTGNIFYIKLPGL